MNPIVKVFGNTKITFSSIKGGLDMSPLAVVKGIDLAKTLGYGYSKHLYARLDSDYKITDKNGNVWVTEPGMYQAIFGSQLDSAKAFQRWVFEEVLPSIRKQGMYLSEARKKQMLALVGVYDALDAYYIYSNNNRLKHLVPKAKESVKYASKALDKLDFSVDELNCVVQGWIKDEL